MDINYIIVQAGGKGTRMEYLTANKPKALVPINNLPMLFHLFKKYPGKRFLIISDYKMDVMKKYLDAFSPVKHLIVNAQGKKGTCGGIKPAIDMIPEDEPFMLIWSDLVLPESFELPASVVGDIKINNLKRYLPLKMVLQVFSCLKIKVYWQMCPRKVNLFVG